jgi:hypothetical protein
VTTEFGLKLAGVFLGVLARAVVPWLRKVREGQATGFDRRYLVATSASLALGLILTLVVFPQLAVPDEGPGFEAGFKLFCLAFGFGFGWNGMVVEGGQWAAGGRS